MKLCNYTCYGNYAGDNVGCIYEAFEMVLSVTGMLVDLSVGIMQVTVSVAIMQLEVSAALMQVTVSAANMLVMGVYVAIMQMVLSAVDYAHDSLYCNYEGDSFLIAM